MNKIIKLVYFPFLFFILTGSDLYLGPITAKYVLGLLLFILLILHDKKLVMDKCFRLYCVFISVFFISSVICGYINEFVVTFFNYYFIAYVGWRGTNLLVQEDEKYAYYAVYIILAIGAFDVLVTLSQMTFNISWYRPIESFFGFRTHEAQMEALDRHAEYRNVFSYTITGIFGNAVKNGWYLAVCSVLSTIFIFMYKKVVLYILPVFFLLGTFACQERSALAAAIIVICVISLRLFNNFSLIKKIFLVVVLILGIIYLGDYLINFSKVNRLRYTELGMDDTGRSDILVGFFSYLSSNPIFPNFYELIDQGGRPPHNLLFNAYVYGGIVSFVAIITILIKQVKICIKIYFCPTFKYNFAVLTTICAYAVFTMNSIFHNQSIVTGELMPWLLWAIIYSLMQNELKINNMK